MPSCPPITLCLSGNAYGISLTLSNRKTKLEKKNVLPRKPHHKGFKPRKPMQRALPGDQSGKARKPLNRVGKSSRSKQTAAWDRELKLEWAGKGITSCEVRLEGCMGTFGLALAHSKKRRFILTKEDYWSVVAACQKCHDRLDLDMNHEEMQKTVEGIINAR